ncbi:hypothetical protein BGZ95_011048 [Linnemannia exigua]|uniref:Uncharacterized protein n=1 Tax=Linnemannia exigua TaxID=604196 RepID=A0AAD4H5F9_9FUNG|nr:hypothetical protein BGZ95_011048 [Linnemannia exigua]
MVSKKFPPIAYQPDVEMEEDLINHGLTESPPESPGPNIIEFNQDEPGENGHVVLTQEIAEPTLEHVEATPVPEPAPLPAQAPPHGSLPAFPLVVSTTAAVVHTTVTVDVDGGTAI